MYGKPRPLPRPSPRPLPHASPRPLLRPSPRPPPHPLPRPAPPTPRVEQPGGAGAAPPHSHAWVRGTSWRFSRVCTHTAGPESGVMCAHTREQRGERHGHSAVSPPPAAAFLPPTGSSCAGRGHDPGTGRGTRVCRTPPQSRGDTRHAATLGRELGQLGGLGCPGQRGGGRTPGSPVGPDAWVPGRGRGGVAARGACARVICLLSLGTAGGGQQGTQAG